MIRITALMDDQKSRNNNIIPEHGLSYFVEVGSQKYLFDCGQGPNTWHNARELGLDVQNLDAVILSHSHYDHAGGYRSLEAPSPLLYTGEGFWEEKYSFHGDLCQSRSAGFDAGFLKNRGVTHKIVSDVTEIAPGVFLIGNFPRLYPWETIPERYLRKTEAGFVWDDFRDEICMAIDLGGELAVLVGCAHPGILNMVTRVHQALSLPVRAVFGGIHLLSASEARIGETLKLLHQMGVEIYGLGHCSGDAVASAIAQDSRLTNRRLRAGDAIVLK